MTACGTASTESTGLTSADTNTSTDAGTSADTDASDTDTVSTSADADESTSDESTSDVISSEETEALSSTTVNSSVDGILDTSDMFTDRDLEQEADLTDAVYYTVSDGEDITITEEGVYVISGSASNVTIYVEAADTDKVQIVLAGVTITNTDMPCIYVKEADKVFVTTSADSTLTVSGTFAEDAENNVDAAIYSCSDLVLNGTATLTITSTDVCVDTKDDLKVTGGTYVFTAGTKGFEANDSIRIADGDFTITAGTDGLHAENSDDDSLGYIYIAGGTFNIDAGDDGIHAVSVLQIDGGTFDISAYEGLEATYVQINGGTIVIEGGDDGINAAGKSGAYSTMVEITGGEITITMASGDTDGIDSNGDVIISGGYIDITCNSGVDFDGNGTLSGGTLIVNGEEQTELVSDMMGMSGMGGQMDGGMGGQMDGGMGGQMNGGMGGRM